MIDMMAELELALAEGRKATDAADEAWRAGGPAAARDLAPWAKYWVKRVEAALDFLPSGNEVDAMITAAGFRGGRF